MATLVDPGRIGVAKSFSDQFGGNPSSVIYGQPLVSFEADGGWWQFAAWYAPDNSLQLARKDPSGTWSTITLPISLQHDDSHNCIVLGTSAVDGRLHVCAGQHNDPMFYTRSYAGFLTDGWSAPWNPGVFEPVTATLAGTVVGELTYPTFVAKPSGGLLFAYRSGGSGNGVMRLAEYDGTWTLLGDVSSATGSWTAPNGAVSTTRNLYWAHPLYDGDGVLHLTGTWREANGAVLCHPSSPITNHHVLYVRSSDDGRTWQTASGIPVATTGAAPLHVGMAGIHIPSFANTNLAHQVSDLAIGPGLVGILPDYVDPSLLSGSPKCVTSLDERFSKAGQGPRWLSGGVWDAEMVKVDGTIVRTGYPAGRKASTRGRMAFSPSGDMVLIFSGFRILSAPGPNYTDWTVDEDGANTAYAFGEVAGVDRARESEGLLSALYMRRDGVMVVRDILL